MAQWLDPTAPMLARSLKMRAMPPDILENGIWAVSESDAPPITAYGFDQSLTNFEGMGPKLLPLTLKPGQDANKPGRIWGDATRLGDGVRWMQRSKITEGFVDAAIPFIQKAKKDEKPFYINLWPDDVHTPFASRRSMGTDRNASSFSRYSKKWTANWASFSIIFR